MTFDIIEISPAEAEMLETIQLKLLRTAQQKKNELYHDLQKNLAEYRSMTYANGTDASTLYESVAAELTAEYEYKVAIIREQLIFNMSLKEPVSGEETGGGTGGGDQTGYVVDYELSYLERYVAVRDYYMTIEDPDERLALYAADGVALRYLDSYYNHLFNYLASYT